MEETMLAPKLSALPKAAERGIVGAHVGDDHCHVRVCAALRVPAGDATSGCEADKTCLGDLSIDEHGNVWEIEHQRRVCKHLDGIRQHACRQVPHQASARRLPLAPVKPLLPSAAPCAAIHPAGEHAPRFSTAPDDVIIRHRTHQQCHHCPVLTLRYGYPEAVTCILIRHKLLT